MYIRHIGISGVCFVFCFLMLLILCDRLIFKFIVKHFINNEKIAFLLCCTLSILISIWFSKSISKSLAPLIEALTRIDG